MTILESLACGTPVLSTDVGGISSLKRDCIPCYTVSGRDVFVFVKKIKEIDAAVYFNDLLMFPYSASRGSESINNALRLSRNKNNH